MSGPKTDDLVGGVIFTPPGQNISNMEPGQYRVKTVSNGKILKNFDEITHKTPHRLFFENFRKFRKFSKIFENLTPKTP